MRVWRTSASSPALIQRPYSSRWPSGRADHAARSGASAARAASSSGQVDRVRLGLRLLDGRAGLELDVHGVAGGDAEGGQQGLAQAQERAPAVRAEGGLERLRPDA